MRKLWLTAYLYAFSSRWATASIIRESVLCRLPGAGSAGERRPEAEKSLHEVQQVALWCPESAANRSSLPVVVPHLLQCPCPKPRHRQIQPSPPLPSYEWILRTHRDSNGVPQRFSYLQGMLFEWALTWLTVNVLLFEVRSASTNRLHGAESFQSSWYEYFLR